MKDKMIAWAIAMLLERLTSDNVKEWLDMGLDMLEVKAEATPNKIDDMVLKIVRESLSIPEFDDEDE